MGCKDPWTRNGNLSLAHWRNDTSRSRSSQSSARFGHLRPVPRSRGRRARTTPPRGPSPCGSSGPRSRARLASSLATPFVPCSNACLELTLEHAPRLILEAMADCCCQETEGVAAACPTCHGASKPVDSLTVKALLTATALQRFQPRDYRFCAAPDCDVVYFAQAGPMFTSGELRERVWQKEPPGQRTLCYCFGENEGDIAAEIGRTGASLAVARVRAHIAAGRCACADPQSERRVLPGRRQRQNSWPSIRKQTSASTLSGSTCRATPDRSGRRRC